MRLGSQCEEDGEDEREEDAKGLRYGEGEGEAEGGRRRASGLDLISLMPSSPEPADKDVSPVSAERDKGDVGNAAEDMDGGRQGET